MQPLTTNDDDMMVYCDWLEDEGKYEEANDLREEIINPNVESWYWEYRDVGSSGNYGGVGADGVAYSRADVGSSGLAYSRAGVGRGVNVGNCMAEGVGGNASPNN